MAVPPQVIKFIAMKVLNSEGGQKLILSIVIGSLLFICILLFPIYILLNPIDTIKMLVSDTGDLEAIQNVKEEYQILEIRELVYKGGKLPIPLEGVVTSEYGSRILFGEDNFHTGIDISGKWHDEIIVVYNGTVTFAGVQNGYGNCIEIKHEYEGQVFYTFYAHLSKILVTTGQQVIQGNVIALEGGDPEKDENAGTSTGHHLHFEIRKSDKSRINPRAYIFGEGG